MPGAPHADVGGGYQEDGGSRLVDLTINKSVIPGPSQQVRPEVAGPMTSSARNPDSIVPALRISIADLPLRGKPE